MHPDIYIFVIIKTLAMFFVLRYNILENLYVGEEYIMKKLVCILICVAVVLGSGFVYADSITSEFTYDENYNCALNNGYEYLGFMGELTFSADVTGQIDYAGCELMCVNPEIGMYLLPFDIKLVAKDEQKNFMLRITGRPLRADDGPYRLTPYVVSDGKKITGAPVEFTVSETCELMTNMRIVYDQIQYIEFSDEEKEILDIVLPVVEEVIAAGESGVKVTKQYVKETYPDEIAKVKSMDSKEQRDAFDKKLRGNIDEQARKYFAAMLMS